MAQIVQVMTMLAFNNASTSTSSSPLIVNATKMSLCRNGSGCGDGQLCFEQPSTCTTTPCKSKYTCASADLNQKNEPISCKVTKCANDYDCITGTSRGPPNENVPLDICVHPCWVKPCQRQGYDACAMKPDSNGNKKAECGKWSSTCTSNNIKGPNVGDLSTCSRVRCVSGHCLMVDCKDECIPQWYR